MANRDSLYEHAGGAAAFERLAEAHYRRCLTDPLLTPQFGTVARPEHAARLAAWLGEVFGGPKTYSEKYGGHEAMVGHHRGRAINEEQRARFVTAMLEAADEAELPADPAFRDRFRAYLEWGTDLAVHYSAPAAAPPPQNMPMPHWDWNTAPGPPGGRISALAPAEEEHPVAPADDGEELRFETHIKPLFRERDRQSMKFAFDLWDYEEVKRHADGIAERLRGGSMPCDGAWPADKVQVFERWIESGMLA